MSISTETQHRWFTTYVQALVTAIGGGPVAPDVDGDFPVHGDTALGWVRPELQEPYGVQVFALAAQDVPKRAAVFREINEINAGDPAIRVVMRGHGCVFVEYRLLADAVSEDNLRAVVGRVLQVADGIGPMLAALHGGGTPNDPQPSVSGC
ncbi:MAG: putative sensory transduction regulator [Friedmanniella sp.]|nr:putative sensory transduction regulator [Friedmanniella sp.]